MIVRIESWRVGSATRLFHSVRGRTAQRMKTDSRILPFLAFLLFCLGSPQLLAQDWVHTGTNLGNDRIRIAAVGVAYRPRSAGRSKVTGTIRGTARAIRDMGGQVAAADGRGRGSAR